MNISSLSPYSRSMGSFYFGACLYVPSVPDKSACDQPKGKSKKKRGMRQVSPHEFSESIDDAYTFEESDADDQGCVWHINRSKHKCGVSFDGSDLTGMIVTEKRLEAFRKNAEVAFKKAIKAIKKKHGIDAQIVIAVLPR
jgi:hypothetical protein